MIGKIYDMIIEKNEELKTQIYDIEKYLKETTLKYKKVWEALA